MQLKVLESQSATYSPMTVGWTLEKVADVVESLLEAGKTMTQVLIRGHHSRAYNWRKKLFVLWDNYTTLWPILSKRQPTCYPISWKRWSSALVQIGTTVANIVVNFAGRSLDGIRTALEALLAEGIRLATIIREICRHVSEEMRKGFIEGLIAVGKAPLTLLEEAAKSGTAITLATFSVLLEIWGGYRELTFEERQDARRIFGWSIDLEPGKNNQRNNPNRDCLLD